MQSRVAVGTTRKRAAEIYLIRSQPDGEGFRSGCGFGGREKRMSCAAKIKTNALFILICLFSTLTACSNPATFSSSQPQYENIEECLESIPAPEGTNTLGKMGYSIQVGAFANLDNAVRLETLLENRGIDAYYFRHESGLFKVRFGNHGSYQSARQEAEQLQAQGLIGNFFIVIPESYAAARLARDKTGALREELVKTARGFLGVPYRWGGTDCDKGFDCSGLTMVCYRLNGLNLPRVSRNQFQSGHNVSKRDLRKGDLVFFATNGGRRVSHVGMYVGNNRFIHAPRTGKTVRVENLNNPFFRKTYVGARSYL